MSLIQSLQIPRYNVSPGQEIITLVEEEGSITPRDFCWGYPPPDWMTGFTKKLINARAEGIDRKPMFRESFIHQRCLVLASGFYEWEHSKRKIPYYFYLPNSPVFCMAGIFSTSQKESLQGIAILTTTPNEIVSRVHERMPVILDEAGSFSWIQTKTTKDILMNLLKPYPAPFMKSHAISNLINSPSYDGENLIKPIETGKQDSVLY